MRNYDNISLLSWFGLFLSSFSDLTGESRLNNKAYLFNLAPLIKSEDDGREEENTRVKPEYDK